MLRGFGVPASYEALRDLCATDVDGTSIDAVESVARAAGLDASQLVVPAEHVFALPEEYLPAIAVTLLPDGFTHFVLLWRVRRRTVTVMDPAAGRRRIPRRALVAELYRHRVVVPAAAWRDWAGSDVFTAALRRRLAAVGVEGDDASALLGVALDDAGPEGVARLDAAVRAEEAGPRRAGALGRVRHSVAEGVDDEMRSCLPDPAGDSDGDGPATVLLRGAVIVRAGCWEPGDADPEMAALLAGPEPGAWATLARVVDRPAAAVAAVVAAGAAAAVAEVAEMAALRPFVDGGAAPSAALAVAVVAAAATIVLAGIAVALRTGRRFEASIRRAWWTALPLLPEGFARTRPASDLAERGHLLHRIRETPTQVVRVALALTLAVAAAAVILVVAPGSAPAVAVLVAVAVGGPVLGTRRAAEADLRIRTLAGCLTRFTVDSLLGAHAVTHGCTAEAVRHEHDRTLASWRDGVNHLVVLTALIRAGSGAMAAGAAAWCIVFAGTDEPGRALLVAAAALLVIDAGAVLADSLRTVPVVRSVVARIAGPLAAARTERDHDGGVGSPDDPATAVHFDHVGVMAGALAVLDDVDLVVPEGAHVAVVGPSGAGKSTLLAVALGLTAPTTGRVTLHPRVQAGRHAWIAPATRLWNDTVAANVAYGADSGARRAADRLATAEAATLAERLDTRGDGRVGDGGGLLSDGEAQRVRLARALGRPSAPLVVLDEAFRGLERDRRRRLLARARERWSGSTLLCALHEIEDTIDFDLVVVMEAGRVTEVGPPPTLSADPASTYRRMLEAALEPAAQDWAVARVGRDPDMSAAGQTPAVSPTAPRRGPGAPMASMAQPEDAQVAVGPRSLWGWLVAAVTGHVLAVGCTLVALRRLGASLYDRSGQVGWTDLTLPLIAAALLAAAAGWCGGRVGLALGLAYRRRVLDRALVVDPDRSRGLGHGRALALALDAELVGSFLVTTGPTATLGTVEVVAALVLARSTAAPRATALVILAALVAMVALTRRLRHDRRRWTASRTGLTGRLVERLIGLDTIRLQDDPTVAADEGRARLRVHDRAGRAMDRWTVILTAVPAITTLTLVAIALVGRAPDEGGAATATALGVALLAGIGLGRLATAATDLVGALDAHEGVSDLAAMARPAVPRPPPAADGALLTARGVTATFDGGRSGLLEPTDLTVRAGDRMVITGPSGGGKTTFAQVLTGERAPSSGTVEWEPGLTVGRVPQAGDDHIFQASLLFNVLCARAWPPSEADVERAERLLDEVGLGPLLARMPGGLSQPIGDGGWRLSSGEAARISLTRVLATEPDVLILDETIAALDAASRDLVVSAAHHHSRATLLIAHF